MHVNEDDIAKAEKATKVPVANDGDDKDRYSISLLFIRTVLQRVFAIMLGMEPEWVEALRLLSKLMAGAPLASVLADEDYIARSGSLYFQTWNGERSNKIKNGQLLIYIHHITQHATAKRKQTMPML
jgi:hypothetical protein